MRWQAIWAVILENAFLWLATKKNIERISQAHVISVKSKQNPLFSEI